MRQKPRKKIACKKRKKLKRSNTNEFKFQNRFPRYREIQRYLRQIEKKFPSNARIETIAKTFRGKCVDMIVLTQDHHTKKYGILIDAGIHAREWITHTSALFIIHYLMQHKQLLRYFDFYIIPCLNPDGYEYTHRCDRLWRKNLNPNGSRKKEYQGVDLNRNFPYGYGIDSGSSSDRRSFSYRGKHALSEPEAMGLDNVMRRYKHYIKLYVSLHTYGNCIMYPWGFTKRPACDEAILYTCANIAKNAMFKLNKRVYRVGSVARKMYMTSGNTGDHAKGTHNIKFVYTIELQRGGKSGFEINKKKILEIAQEVMVGIETMAKYVYCYSTGLDTDPYPCPCPPLPKRRKLNKKR